MVLQGQIGAWIKDLFSSTASCFGRTALSTTDLCTTFRCTGKCYATEEHTRGGNIITIACKECGRRTLVPLQPEAEPYVLLELPFVPDSSEH